MAKDCINDRRSISITCSPSCARSYLTHSIRFNFRHPDYNGAVNRLWFGLLALIFCMDGFAADGWRVESRHFTLIGNANEAQMTAVAAGLEDFLPAVLQHFPN